ncbi:hypothetical protein [Microlunatus soli]|uniref:Precorrin-3B synthase n=1 Tax=Microlunatus soli TaxID=630515 RepID=A0A1H1ZGF0_9ACTN|nr:hypothetical protein [Microlunatus soli]SDT32740.1 precorrin-3B synthase [Microlunatus soli]
MIDPGHLRADRCPGLLSPHRAEDGLLVRIRVPGGRLTTVQLAGLGRLAAEYGQPELHLTSRANLQLRGVSEDRLDDLGAAVASLGLLPSPEHDRVRNIVASPLAGLSGRPSLDRLITELDRSLCAAPELAALPGRFLFALDDGSGDVGSLRFDLGLRRLSTDTAMIMIGTSDEPVGAVVPTVHAVPAMIMIARRFVAVRETSPTAGWHLREIDPGRLAGGLRPIGELVAGGDVPPVEEGAVAVGSVDGAASVAVPLGRLSAPQINAIVGAAGDGSGSVILTPWRGVVLPDAAARLPELAAAGLIVEADSSWNSVTACVGSPGCARSAIDTRAAATELVSFLESRRAFPVSRESRASRIHLSGCDRRCGRPTGEVVDLIAPPDTAAAVAALDAGQGEPPSRRTRSDHDQPTAGSA